MTEKLIRWFIFSVVIALTPILFNIISILFSEEINFSFFLLVSKGESFLISAVIAAAAIGDLIATGKKWVIGKILSGGSCVILLLLSSYLFSHISSLAPIELHAQIGNVNFTSIFIFSCTVFSSGFCVGLAKID